MLAIGCGMIAGLLKLNRRTYYHVRTGDRSIAVDEAVIEGYLQRYWETLFPGKEVSSDVTIQSNQIEVSTDLPHIPFNQQRDLLKRIERELADVFDKVLDSDQEFLFSANFAEGTED